MLALLMFIVIFAVSTMSIDIAKLFCVKVAVKYKLNLACRSAAAQVDENELAGLRLVIDEPRAIQAFLNVLKKNLVLDDMLIPQVGSILNAGPVKIEYFKAVKSEELPFSYTYGSFSETLNKVCVVAIISFPVKSGLFTQLIGGHEESVMYCHITAAPELVGG